MLLLKAKLEVSQGNHNKKMFGKKKKKRNGVLLYVYRLMH